MKHFFTLLTVLFLFSCSEESKPRVINLEGDLKLFDQVSTEESGLDFRNDVINTSSFNVINYQGLLQGSGVGILDVNNDGLRDIYFGSSTGKDQLYLNKGDFKFENITSAAGIIQDQSYTSGISVVDINGDGYDDIYISKFLHDNPELLKNRFYINNGDNTFTDKASELNVQGHAYSIIANFFDFDKDGDLDFYVANQPPNSVVLVSQLKGKTTDYYTDVLYRNDGGKFTDITKEAGITNYNYSLSVSPIDYDNDGDLDIYVACDYEEPDHLFKNNGDGTFTDVAGDAFKHISNFSMGSDIADINNDGLLDIFSVDMVAEDNFRLKTNMGGMNPEKFWNLVKNGYHHQYMFNAMQLNNGDGTFSEIAQLSGISNTDWSWAPIFVDFDQDGHKDLFVTNGIIKEVRNKDFQIWKDDYIAQRKEELARTGKKSRVDPMILVDKVPSFKIQNFIYKNKGDLTFEKRNDAWGTNQPSWSQGAAIADFDNDGDPDLLVSNMNMEPFLYRNNANENALNNYVSINLEKTKRESAVVKINTPSGSQVSMVSATKGYMSSVDPMVHFGLGEDTEITGATIYWNDGMKQDVKLKVNTINDVEYNPSGKGSYIVNTKPLFAGVTGANVSHQENENDDYLNEILLPYKTSTLGPCVATADVNGDGQDDFYLGGSAGSAGQLFLSKGGQYELSQQSAISADKGSEDGAATFFDADGDGDQDLYVASGGNEINSNPGLYQDRLYLNNNGVFQKSNLPKLNGSNHTVLPIDVDGDNDFDLFVGGRLIPGKYGFRTDSKILKNENGRYSDITETYAPMLNKLGMVTSAIAGDLDKDGKDELIVAGEWMPVMVFECNENGLEDVSENFIPDHTKGWWNTLELADLDGDGDLDMLAGNLGLNLKYKANSEQPFKLYVDDFDKNGSNDVYLGYYDKDGKCYPVRGRQCSSQQMPFVKKEFVTYEEFGNATIDKVLKDKLSQNSGIEEVDVFENVIFINDGSGMMTMQVMPNVAQISPIYDFEVLDINQDGNMDFLSIGNYHNREVETTRSDAGKGLVAMGQGDGSFEYYRGASAGLNADMDARAVKLLGDKANPIVAVFNNNGPVQYFKKR